MGGDAGQLLASNCRPLPVFGNVYESLPGQNSPCYSANDRDEHHRPAAEAPPRMSPVVSGNHERAPAD